MKILLVHQNFPGQFKHILEALIKDPKNNVVAFTMNGYQNRPNLRVINYKASKSSSRDAHPWALEMEAKIIRGEAAYFAALDLRKNGFEPDLILAHPGWGESLYLKEVWPNSKLIIYCEFYYASTGLDIGFDPEFPLDSNAGPKIRSKNFNNLVHFDIADAGISPTLWQKMTYPEPFRSKISVIHDGVDTKKLCPDLNARLVFSMGGQKKIELNVGDDVVTFVNRNLEPYRGYHIFMRSLPLLLRDRPSLKVLIVGGQDASYGASPDPTRYSSKSWKEIYAQEAKSQLSEDQWGQIYFLGNIPYENFITLLQISKVHIYLTYPFILSWSLIEALSVGCSIVGSKTGPVEELIKDGENGLLVDFFNHQALAKEVSYLLDNPKKRLALGESARRFAVENYDLNNVCLPQLLNLIDI